MIRFLLRAMRLLLALLWLPTAAVASQVSFGQAMQTITVFEWALIFMFSTLAGATALLMKFSAHVNAVPPGQPVPPMRNPWVLSLSHMLASWLAGLLGFFIASTSGMGGLYVAMFVPLCAFGGAKTLEIFWKQKVGPAASGPDPAS
ncbi:hypothetical protein GT347_16140 [Xylophilus rhododendri]|uniref:Transmembrane protein n=1 Tax=Xylophilus rhododendri TaxID=2697032 RepID=A0A857J5V9_9BURK|nr:hypothetical protein [Xylophilus rhododendri]QHI99374.1 hypothetical protein GT347_16140 [Xylophilus rhododendri]